MLQDSPVALSDDAAEESLLRDAAAGSREAMVALIGVALEAGQQGRVGETESLVAAECYARLAAAIGDAADLRSLACLLLMRCADAQSSGQNPGALKTEAAAILHDLAARGDAEAIEIVAEQELAAIVTVSPELIELDRRIADLFRQAAEGDITALAAMFDGTMLNETHRTAPLEKLVAAEQFARLGSISGDSELLRRLASVLLMRAHWEQRDGDPARALSACVEGFAIVIGLCRSGYPFGNLIRSFADDSAPADLAAVANHLPEILTFATPVGSA